MKEEIKEILTSMHYAGHTFASYRMKSVDILTLLDYITNLQEENERLNNIIEELEKVINNCAVIGEFGTSKMYIDKQYLLNRLKELKEGK